MRLLFVHPGPLLYTNVFLRLEPLGLELVTQAARRAGYSTRLIDLQVESQADYHRMVAEWRPDFVAFILQLPRQRSRNRRSGQSDKAYAATLLYLCRRPQRIFRRKSDCGTRCWRH